MEQKKSQELSVIPGVQFPNDITNFSSDTIIRKARAFVNIKIDSEGNRLTSDQQEYFKDSKVRDENGNLLVVYHGTDADFDVFDFMKAGKNGRAEGYGFYFSDDKEITTRYGENQKKV